jgi:hypothetical protein
MWLKARTRRPHRARSLAVASRPGRDQDQRHPGPGQDQHPREMGVAADDVAVDGLLDQHRGDHPPAPGDQGQGQGEGGPLA